MTKKIYKQERPASQAGFSWAGLNRKNREKRVYYRGQVSPNAKFL